MKSLNKILLSFFFVGALLGGIYLIPWQNINWGKLEMMPAATITVTGQAQGLQKNQIATFTAGVSAINDDKEQAIAEVNQKAEQIIQAVKQFGIPDKDIQTQNLSVNQRQEQYWEDDRQKTRKGQWSVNNSIELTLREIDRADKLAALLGQTNATNIYGPNFRVDDSQQADDELLAQAIKDAQEKAQVMAQASQAKLGKIVSVTEGYQSSSAYPIRLDGMGGGGGAPPVEPGTSTVSKSVTVIFELK